MKTISTGKAFNELDSKELGKWGERIATQYIEKLGLTVVDTNYRTRLGEIDIIAKRDLVYHFIEIKAIVACSMDWPVRRLLKRNKSILNGLLCYFYMIYIKRNDTGKKYPLML